MTPRELWNLMGTMIAEECKCEGMWDYSNGEPRGTVTPEEMFAIYRRVRALYLSKVQAAEVMA